MMRFVNLTHIPPSSMAVATTDSPSRNSGKSSTTRTEANVPRGDSLVYSEDSQDQRSLLSAAVKGAGNRSTTKQKSSIVPTKMNEPKKNCCQNQRPVSHNDSIISHDSFNEKSKNACCTIQ
jgi:hypothetical protein